MPEHKVTMVDNSLCIPSPDKEYKVVILIILVMVQEIIRAPKVVIIQPMKANMLGGRLIPYSFGNNNATRNRGMDLSKVGAVLNAKALANQ